MGKHLNLNDVQSVKKFKKKTSITISLIVITFLFLLMTLPNNLFYAYFYKLDLNLDLLIGSLTNDLTFLHHYSTLFFQFISYQHLFS